MRGKVSEAQELYNRYIIVATSFGEDVAAKSIMELYRMRWEVELVFKELKSLFGYNQIPSKLDTTARAWFYGKLLLAALCETIVNKGRFSP
jgi:IS4 transposase